MAMNKIRAALAKLTGNLRCKKCLAIFTKLDGGLCAVCRSSRTQATYGGTKRIAMLLATANEGRFRRITFSQAKYIFDHYVIREIPLEQDIKGVARLSSILIGNYKLGHWTVKNNENGEQNGQAV